MIFAMSACEESECHARVVPQSEIGNKPAHMLICCKPGGVETCGLKRRGDRSCDACAYVGGG